VRDVKVLPEEAEARPAAMNDKVGAGEAVRTGDASRSELTFPDLTISRLGANTIYSFNRAGRDVSLTNGSILLRVPKGSGGGQHSDRSSDRRGDWHDVDLRARRVAVGAS
jgi:hypothetical protein